MSYKTGIDRAQNNILPDNLDAFIAEDNLVRVIDAFVDYLDLEKLGFVHTTDHLLGASMYPPSMLLKLYLYGYFNRIRSSRRLALECTRNIELYWLLHLMMPHYHTIADFRKNNPSALKGVFKEFTQFCISMSLIEGQTIVFDGTKIRAQNNQKNNFNAARLDKLLARILVKTGEFEHYLKELEAQDKGEPIESDQFVAYGKTKESVEKTLSILAVRKKKYEGYQRDLKALAEAGCPTEDLQISTVDVDARVMSFKQSQVEVGYNVQSAGDAKHKLIVNFEVTNVSDLNALFDLAIDTKVVLKKGKDDTYNVLADAGYHTGEELEKCAQANIITYVCPTNIAAEQSKKTKKKQDNRFVKEKFIYDAKEDAYTCPNQQSLRSNGTWYVHKAKSKRKKDRKYKQYTLPSKTCQACPFAAQCQGSRFKNWHGRIIERTEFDDAVEANQKRWLQNPKVYQQRKEIIEHPFGTIKRSWGNYYTLLKTKKKVTGEFALIFLCYNLRRAINILGVEGLKNAIKGHFTMFLTLLRAITVNLIKKDQPYTKSKFDKLLYVRFGGEIYLYLMTKMTCFPFLHSLILCASGGFHVHLLIHFFLFHKNKSISHCNCNTSI
jgi:transposase